MKEKGAQFKLDIKDLAEEDVANYQVKLHHSDQPSAASHSPITSSRKMRMNINGRDTGWVDVTDENEA